MKNFKLSHLPLILWTSMFTIAPELILGAFAFTNKTGQFTFENLIKINKYWHIFFRSIKFATLTTIVCLCIAYPFSYFVFKTVKSSSQKLIISLITLPTWTNLLLRTFAWMTLIEKNGLINKILKFLNIPELKLINTPAAVVIVMVYDFLPFMIIPIYSSMTKIDKNLIEASADLGANELQTLKKVIMPLSLKGVLQGIGLIFVLSCSTFIIPKMMSGGKIILIGDLIESQFMGPIYNPWLGSAFALSLNIIIVLIILLNKSVVQTKKGATQNDKKNFL